MPYKVMSIMGTRPEAIKMAPLLRLLVQAEDITSILCLTAQHREMLDQVLTLFALDSQYDLDIMRREQSLTHITTRALEGLEEIVKAERPHLVLVHGDTTTTFAGSLAAFYQQVPVGHVEAGLRTGNKYAPFPEEINRRLAATIAELHFAPTAAARENLLREGVSPQTIFVTGNTVIDALQTTVRPDYQFGEPALQGLDLSSSRIILLETHRRENLGEPMRQCCLAVRRLLDDFPDTFLLFPVHKNPAVRRIARECLEGHPRAILLEPLDTLDFHNLMARSHLILTDSGGIQEEAPSLGVPVIVLRTVTERPEAIAAGTAILAGTSGEQVYTAAARLLQDRNAYAKMARTANPYGDGHASERIMENIRAYWRSKQS